MMREYKNVYPELYKELSDDVKGYYSFDYSSIFWSKSSSDN